MLKGVGRCPVGTDGRASRVGSRCVVAGAGPGVTISAQLLFFFLFCGAAGGPLMVPALVLSGEVASSSSEEVCGAGGGCGRPVGDASWGVELPGWLGPARASSSAALKSIGEGGARCRTW